MTGHDDFRYLKIRQAALEESVEVFEKLEDANAAADAEWKTLTAYEMVRTTIKVVKVYASDVECEVTDWARYHNYHQPEEEEFFDSDLF